MTSYGEQLGLHYHAVRNRLRNGPAPVETPTQTVKVILGGAPPVLPKVKKDVPLPEINYPSDVIPYVCVKHRVTPQLLKGDARNKHASRVRWEAYQILSERFGISPSRIGLMFNKDHTSVMYGLKRMAEIAAQAKEREQ